MLFSSSTPAFRRQLNLTTALLALGSFGYGARGAYAGSCLPGVNPGEYICSGPILAGDVTQTLSYTGVLSVTTQALFGIDTTPNGGDAFELTSVGGLTFLDQNASDITGAAAGIEATNSVSGSLSITSDGTIQGGTRDGIHADNSGTDLILSVDSVTGADQGIYARNAGTGNLDIMAFGQITGATDYGIYALNNATSSMNLIIDVIGVSGGNGGFYAANDGAGQLSITATGMIDGGTGNGVNARSEGLDLLVDVYDVVSVSDGLQVSGDGTGIVFVTGRGQITSRGGIGIEAFGNANNSDMTIDLTSATGGVSGADDGINADNDGTGQLTITSLGQIDSDAGDGINADNDGTNLLIDVAGVTGGDDGIRALGTYGYLTINTTGTVSGTNGYGIYAYNDGAGQLTITAQSLIEGRGDQGIYASNGGANMLIDVAGVSGAATGIEASGTSGYLTVNVSGEVRATNIHGIFALRESVGTAGHLTINSTSTLGVSGGTGGNGIVARQYGSDDLVIQAVGPISGGQNGIFANNYGRNTDIDVVDVSGSLTGIDVDQDVGSSGYVNITSTGQVTGGAGVGILANMNGGTDLIIDAHDVSGDRHAIWAFNDGNGAIDITLDGIVRSTGSYATDRAILTETSGAATTITLNSGANVSAANGLAITNDENDSYVTVNGGATLSGDVLLDYGGTGYGSDSITFQAGSDVSGIGILDGGDDDLSADGNIDTLVFDGASGTAVNGEFRNWENIGFDNANVRLANTIAFDSPEFTYFLGNSRFEVGGDFNLDGTLRMNFNNSADDELIVGGDFNILTGATLNVDVDFATHQADTITVQGVVTTASTFSIGINAINLTSAQGYSIPIVLVNGGALQGPGTLTAGQITANNFVYDLYEINDSWYLSTSNVLNLPPVDTGTFESYQSALLDQAGLTTYAERVGARYFDGTGESLQKRFALWSRIEGATSDVGTDGSESNADYELNQRRIEAGFDVVLGQSESGIFYAGFNGGIGQSAMDAVADGVTGTADSDVYTVGATLTFAGHNGFYADAQVKHVWFETDLADDTGTSLVDGTEASALIAGLEVGQSVMVSDNLTLTPQAQLTYASLDVDDFTSSTGQAISFDNADSLALRLGVSAEAGLGANGSMGTVRVLSNVTHEFLGKTEGDADGTTFSRDRADWTGELGLQFAVGNTEDGISLHGGASLSGDLENLGDTHTAKGNLGVRVKM